MRFKTTVAISLSVMRTIFHAQRMIHRANGYSIFSYLHHRTLSGDQSYLDLVTKPNHPNLMVIDPYILTRTVTSLSYLCFSLILCSYSLSSGLRHVACKGEINLFCSEYYVEKIFHSEYLRLINVFDLLICHRQYNDSRF